MNGNQRALPRLDQLATSVIVLDAAMRIVYANTAAEALFAFSAKQVAGVAIEQVLGDVGMLQSSIEHALRSDASYIEHELVLTSGRQTIYVACSVTPLHQPDAEVVLEFNQIDNQLRIAREERMQLQQQANRELLRNLAHEIKNPLGGLRGAAQLLESELPKAGLREYTQVIIKEADRLQSLMDRLLTPHRTPKPKITNIHEVLERVRSLALAETPEGVTIRRDYDISIPEFFADQEQLIQAVLNIVRNALQAMRGRGEITLRTRIVRHVTLARKRFRMAMNVSIIDSGPGIPPELQERIFYPLVSGREGGTGLGLTLAQTFVAHHNGIIEFSSEPGRTCFDLMLPIAE